MGAFGDFYTFVKDLRPFGNGTPMSYRYDRTAFTSDAQGELGSGEMLGWDATNQRILRFNRTAANGKFIGLTRDSATGLQKLGNQAALNLAVADYSVFTSGVHMLVGTVGDTYNHGNAVYMSGTDTTKITKTQGSNGVQVGTVYNPLNSSVVGAVRVPVLIDEYTVTQT